MNPFGYNLKSRCRNRAKRFSNRPVSRNSDVFGYNERSEVMFSRGDAEDAEYSYDEIGNLFKYHSFSITNHYVANNLNQYTTILRDSATPREINPQCDLDGNLISKSGPLADFFRHRFSTKYFDIESGLYYYGYRFYHPTLMRWLNRDPIEEDGGLNLYGFCGNIPVFSVDFLGNARMITGALMARKNTKRIIFSGYDKARKIIRLVDNLNKMRYEGRKLFDARLCDFVTTPISEIKIRIYEGENANESNNSYAETDNVLKRWPLINEENYK